jgi:hypothetical protein
MGSLANAMPILPQEAVRGSPCLRDGRIAAVLRGGKMPLAR